jgi:hypothetical protein
LAVPLTLAGAHSVAAEFTETRAGLLEPGGEEGEGDDGGGRGGRAASAGCPSPTTAAPTLVRSVALALDVVPGPAAGVVVVPQPATALAVADGPDPAGRALLPSAGAPLPHAQVVDAHGNACRAGGVRLRAVLVGPDDDAVAAAAVRRGGGGGGGGTPHPVGASLLDGGVIGGKTDGDGRMDLSVLAVAPGAVRALVAAGGRDENNANPAAPLAARLVIVARGLPGGGGGGGAPASAWSPAWECAVLVAADSGGAPGAADALRAAAAEHAAAVEARLGEVLGRAAAFGLGGGGAAPGRGGGLPGRGLPGGLLARLRRGRR